MTKEDLVRLLADRHPNITKKDSVMLVDKVAFTYPEVCLPRFKPLSLRVLLTALRYGSSRFTCLIPSVTTLGPRNLFFGAIWCAFAAFSARIWD